MRLLYLTSSLNVRIFVGDDELTGQPPDLNALNRASLTRSPLPNDPGLVQNTNFNRWKDRYRHQQPVEILIVEDNQDGFPVELWTMDQSQRMYYVTYPDLDVSDRGQFGTDLLWKHRKDDLAISTPVFSSVDPSLYVYADAAQSRPAMAQLAPSKWDVKFYFPTRNRGYESRTQFIKHPGREDVFHLTYPYFRWQSCDGELVWMGRPAIDARSIAKGVAEPTKELVLLDVYDRIIAMVKVESQKQTFKEAYAEARRIQKGELHLEKKFVRELRLYGTFSKQLVLEIVTSYTVLMVQRHRSLLLYSLRRQKKAF